MTDRYITLQPKSKLPTGPWRRQSLSRAEAEAAGGNVGLRTGRGLLVVDVDDKHGNDGMAAWLDLCRQHGFEPSAPVVRTPSGGWHIYFAAPRSRRLAGHVGILPGVDLRGDGNYVLVPPSRTEAGEYRYVDPARTEAGPHPPAPRWLLDLARPGRKKGHGKGAALDLPADPEPATAEEVEEALARLAARWPAMPWRAIWAGEEMTADRHGAVRTPSQRDQMLAYRLAAVGFAPAEIARLMTACPAVRARRKGRQPDAWRRPSYRQATIQAAVDLVQRHRAGRAHAPAGQDEAADDAIAQALALLRQAPGWEIWAAQAMIVRRRAARDGQPQARMTRRIWLDRLAAAGVRVSERQYRQTYDARRNPLLRAAEDVEGLWWYGLAEDKILLAAEEAKTMRSQAPAGSAAGRSAGLAGTGSASVSHIRVYSRDHSAQNVYRPAGRTSRKGRRKTSVIGRVEALLRQGKQPAEIAQILDISRAVAKTYAYRLRQRQAAEAAAEAPRPEPAAEAVDSIDVAWSLTPARRLLQPVIPPEALRQRRRQEAWLRAADRIDAYARAVCAPDGWDARIPAVIWPGMAPQEAAQAVIRTLGSWLRLTPPAEWLPDHQQAIRDWIAQEEDRHCRALARLARQRGVRRVVSHRSDALLLEMAIAALFMRPAGLPEEWLARTDHGRTADHFRAFREAWEMRWILDDLRREAEEAEARRPDPAQPAEVKDDPCQPAEPGEAEQADGPPRKWTPMLGRSRYHQGERPIFACAVTMHLIV